MKHLIVVAVIYLLASCAGSKTVSTKKEEAKTQSALSENLQQKLSAGIDLYAKGAVPSSWTLEIDFDRTINFRSLDGTDYKSTPVQPVENTTDQSWVIAAKATGGEMLITLYKEGCTDALSGEKFSKKVIVEAGGKRYEGCGQYLADARLNGKWQLEKKDATTLSAADFAKGLPELVFDTDAGKITGHDGCNRISGAMEVQGNRIRFSAIAGTKMACPANKQENEFLHKLSNKIASYYFKESALVLYLVDDSTLTFKKS